MSHNEEMLTKRTMTRNRENGLHAARSFGAEYQANPGSSKSDYLNDAAYYFGDDVEGLQDLSDEDRRALRAAFQEGVEAEKRLQ